MKTKSLFLIQFFVLTAFIFSCSSEDDNKALSFKNQDVQGELFGADWEYADGSATLTEIDGQALFGVALYASFDDDDCRGAGNETGDNEVGFYVPRVAGVYKLKSDPDFPMLHVALINVDSEAIIYAYEGSIEILTISETAITGRVVARKGDNIVNGNFEAQLCIVPDGEPMRLKSH